MMVISEIRYLRFYNCSVIQTGGHSTKKTGFQNLTIYIYISKTYLIDNLIPTRKEIYLVVGMVFVHNTKKKKKKLTTPRNVNNVFIKNHKNKQ